MIFLCTENTKDPNYQINKFSTVFVFKYIYCISENKNIYKLNVKQNSIYNSNKKYQAYIVIKLTKDVQGLRGGTFKVY